MRGYQVQYELIGGVWESLATFNHIEDALRCAESEAQRDPDINHRIVRLVNEVVANFQGVTA